MHWDMWQDCYWVKQKEHYRDPYQQNISYKTKERRIRKRNKIRKKIANWQNLVDNSRPEFQQCKQLISRFGGIIPFSIVVQRHPEDIICYWLGDTKAKRRFDSNPKLYTQGLIPYHRLPGIILAARYWGILLRPQDIYPDYVDDDGVKNIRNKEEIMRWLKQIEPNAKMQQFENVIASLVSTPD